MGIVTEVVGLLAQVKPEDIEALPPASRRQLAQRLRYLAELAERGDPPKGILGRLRRRPREG